MYDALARLDRRWVFLFMLLAMIFLSSSLIHAGDSQLGSYRIHSIAGKRASD